MQRISVIVILATTLGSILSGCEWKINVPPQDSKFVIAIVGDGVPSSNLQINSLENMGSTPNMEQGRAMYDGVMAAAKGRQFGDLESRITIETYNDYGRKDQAEAIARTLANRSEVLAVIGHGTSATTQAAASIYQDRGIPLIMPIATNPEVVSVLGIGGQRKNRANCFRLPSDDTVQVNVIVQFSQEVLKGSSYFIIYDSSTDTRAYSLFLSRRIQDTLGSFVIEKCDWGLEKSPESSLRAKILSTKPQVIIYCGYANNVNAVIQVLREAYSDKTATERPRLVLSDSCKYPNLNASGFDTYVTFPCPPVTGSKSEYKQLLDAIKTQENESYQLLGFDALLLLGAAVRGSAHTHISRKSVADYLRDSQELRGLISTYNFKNSENTNSNYYVYNVKSLPLSRTEMQHFATFKQGTITIVGQH